MNKFKKEDFSTIQEFCAEWKKQDKSAFFSDENHNGYFDDDTDLLKQYAREANKSIRKMQIRELTGFGWSLEESRKILELVEWE